MDAHENDVICELLLECRPFLKNCELKTGYDACKTFIEVAKDKAPTQRMFHLQFDCATRLGYTEEAMKIVEDYDHTMEMYLHSGNLFFDQMDFHRARDITSMAIAFAEDPIVRKREDILRSCHQLLKKVNDSLSLLEDTSTQPKNEDKKKKNKKKKKKKPPFGSSHQQIPASSHHPKEYHEEQQLYDIVPTSSSHPKEYHEEQQLYDMALDSSSHPKDIDDQEDLCVGKHLDMNDHIKISVDFQDVNKMFHGNMRTTSKHTMDVSFIPLSNEESDLDLYDLLYNSAAGCTLRVFVLLEHPRHSYMVAERVSFAHSFFKREQGISPTFKKVFRLIMQDFIILVRKGKSIGDFRRCAFVTTEPVEGRVVPSLSLDLKKDLHSYHNFLVELLEHLGIPEILEPYLIELEIYISEFKPESDSTRDAQLLIDCPLFWCSSERINFIHNLFEQFKSKRWGRSVLSQKIMQLTECNWIHLWRDRIKSKTGTVFLGIFEFPIKFTSSTGNVARPRRYTGSGFDFLRYIIAVYHHCNDVMYENHRKHQLVQKAEIEQQLYDIFPEMYLSLMRVAREFIKKEPIDDNTWINFISVGNRDIKLPASGEGGMPLDSTLAMSSSGDATSSIKDEVKKLSPKINLPISEEVKIDNLGSEVAVGTGEQKTAAREGLLRGGRL